MAFISHFLIDSIQDGHLSDYFDLNFVHLEKELTSQTKYPPRQKKLQIKENYHRVFPISDV